MKKYLWAILVLFLAACGSSTSTEEKPQEEPKQTEQKQDERAKEAPAEQTGNADEDDTVNLVEGPAIGLKYYGTEESAVALESDDENGGFVRADFEGFHVDFMVFLVDFYPNVDYRSDFNDKDTVRALLLTIKAENTTDLDVDYGGSIQINTDTKEQVHSFDANSFLNPAIQTYNGKVVEEGYFIIPLKDESNPNEITVRLDHPWIVEDGGVNTDTGMMGEELKFELKGFED